MAVIAGVLSETQRRTLEAVCDIFVPSVEVETDDPVERAFMARAASDLGVAAAIEQRMGDSMNPEQASGLADLLDELAGEDIAGSSPEQRTELIHRTAEAGPEAKLGIKVLRQLTLLHYYGLVDASGRNPGWDALGYPGPPAPPPSREQAPKTISVEQVSGERATLSADVCVVGSGAGGGVIAAELQAAGRSVVVLEMGPYRNEADFHQQELPSMLELYLGGGVLGPEDGSLALLAGSCLGGGTTINYQNCLRTPERILAEWARHGLDGLDSPDYERHLDAIWSRMQVGSEATSHNETHRRLNAALEELGLGWQDITRNADPALEDPHRSGFSYAGDQTGARQGTLKTFLQDAADAGARFVVGARAERITHEGGRATGVEAVVEHEDGSATELTVEAPTVVVACGSVESPALLLRSGIGGPAVGRHLRVQPAAIVLGVYEEPIEGWDGQIQSSVSHALADVEGDWGFVIEGTYMGPSLFAASFPWIDGRQHKQEYARQFRFTAPFITVQRDHGEGEVVLDSEGRALVRWSLTDELDRRLFVRAQRELCRLHRAAGARQIYTMHAQPTRWHEGEDFESFLDSVEQGSYDANDVGVFSAHQLGSCRMGSDSDDSVANGSGELHDTSGVWIGDASAFPTASGVNPMISAMALAHRTAERIAAS